MHGLKTDLSDFFGWNFFSFKRTWIFACAFQLRSKSYICIFWLVCTNCFREKRGQNIEACTMKSTKRNKSIFICGPLHHCVWNKRNFFPFMLFFKKFRHCWREKFTWKSHLGQSCFFSKTKCKPAKKQCRGMFTTKLAVPKIIRELGRVRASFKF